MPWAKIDDRFAYHPKFMAVGLAATGLFVRGLAYSAGFSTDGYLPEGFVKGQLANAAERKLPALLVAHGLWDRIEGGYMIHDYLEYNLSKAQWEQLRAKKAEAGRKGGKAKRQAGA